jgi:hypothetical protein
LKKKEKSAIKKKLFKIWKKILEKIRILNKILEKNVIFSKVQKFPDQHEISNGNIVKSLKKLPKNKKQFTNFFGD